MDQNADSFPLMQVPHNLHVHPGNWHEFPGPIGSVVGPGNPGGVVRFPFRRHPEFERGRHNGQSTDLRRMGRVSRKGRSLQSKVQSPKSKVQSIQRREIKS